VGSDATKRTSSAAPATPPVQPPAAVVHPPLKGEGYSRVSSSPRPAFAVWPLSKNAPCHGGRSREAGHGAEPLNYLVRGANPHPAGDFCPRPFRCARYSLPSSFGAFRHWPRAYVLVQHAPLVSSGRGTLGRGLPGRRLRQPTPEAPSPPHLTTVATGVPAGGARARIRELRGVLGKSGLIIFLVEQDQRLGRRAG